MKLTSVLLFSVILGNIASASTLLQTRTITPYTPGGTRTMSFNQFDTLGNTRTLTGVTISFYFDTTGGSFAVDNDSEEVGFVSFSREIMGKLTSSSVEVGTASTYFSAQSGFTSAI